MKYMKYQEFGFIEAIKLIKYELGNLTAEPVRIFFLVVSLALLSHSFNLSLS